MTAQVSKRTAYFLKHPTFSVSISLHANLSPEYIIPTRVNFDTPKGIGLTIETLVERLGLPKNILSEGKLEMTTSSVYFFAYDYEMLAKTPDEHPIYISILFSLAAIQ